MNLDEELRAVLVLEAERCDTPPPDLEGLVRGGRGRRRRRAAARLGLAAAALVVVGGGAWVIAEVDVGGAAGTTGSPGIAGRPSPTSEASALPGGWWEALGTGVDGASIFVVVPPRASLFPGGTGVVSEKHHNVYVGLAVLQPRNVAGGSSGCTDAGWAGRSREPAGTAYGLAQQLEGLPSSSVLQPATRTRAFGHPGAHVRLRVDNTCPDGQAYLVIEADSDFGIDYGARPADVVLDVTVVQVDGTPVVVALWNDTRASSELVRRAGEVRDSLVFVTGQ